MRRRWLLVAFGLSTFLTVTCAALPELQQRRELEHVVYRGQNQHPCCAVFSEPAAGCAQELTYLLQRVEVVIEKQAARGPWLTRAVASILDVDLSARRQARAALAQEQVEQCPAALMRQVGGDPVHPASVAHFLFQWSQASNTSPTTQTITAT